MKNEITFEDWRSGRFSGSLQQALNEKMMSLSTHTQIFREIKRLYHEKVKYEESQLNSWFQKKYLQNDSQMADYKGIKKEFKALSPLMEISFKDIQDEPEDKTIFSFHGTEFRKKDIQRILKEKDIVLPFIQGKNKRRYLSYSYKFLSQKSLTPNKYFAESFLNYAKTLNQRFKEHKNQITYHRMKIVSRYSFEDWKKNRGLEYRTFKDKEEMKFFPERILDQGLIPNRELKKIRQEIKVLLERKIQRDFDILKKYFEYEFKQSDEMDIEQWRKKEARHIKNLLNANQWTDMDRLHFGKHPIHIGQVGIAPELAIRISQQIERNEKNWRVYSHKYLTTISNDFADFESQAFSLYYDWLTSLKDKLDPSTTSLQKDVFAWKRPINILYGNEWKRRIIRSLYYELIKSEEWPAFISEMEVEDFCAHFIKGEFDPDRTPPIHWLRAVNLMLYLLKRLAKTGFISENRKNNYKLIMTHFRNGNGDTFSYGSLKTTYGNHRGQKPQPKDHEQIDHIIDQLELIIHELTKDEK